MENTDISSEPTPFDNTKYVYSTYIPPKTSSYYSQQTCKNCNIKLSILSNDGNKTQICGTCNWKWTAN